MMLGVCSISFRGHSPEEIVKAAHDCGLDCIEWGSDVHAPYTDTARLDEIVVLSERYGVTCCSYGTYFRLGVTPMTELSRYIAAAKRLGTTILRLWCGNKNSEDYTDAERETLFDTCREAARIAEESGVVLCMECHRDTFTNTKESALSLMEAVNSPSFRMYWQPSQFRSEAENIAYATAISPYTVHLHVFHWSGAERYPLSAAVEVWKRYGNCFDGAQAMLLEFMPDDRLSSLREEVQALKEIVR